MIKQVPLTPTATPTNTPTPTQTLTPTPTATNTPVPDGSRSHPYPIGYVASFTNKKNQNLTVKVTDVTRGNEAWVKIYGFNPYNAPPPAGQEYVVVGISVNYVSGPVDSILNISEWNFGTVSDNVISEYPPSGAYPDPELYANLFPGGSTWGYRLALVYIDDPKPLLFFEDNTVYPYKMYFFSLNQ